MIRNQSLRVSTAVASILLAYAALWFGAVPEGAALGSEPAPVIAEVRQVMSAFVEKGEIAGAVTLVASADQVVHLDAVGHADLASGRPMRPDSIFWIASMTKPITATAVLMLHDEGKLALDDPVERHLPEFSALKTKDGQAAQVTIRHLLTHTSGLSEISSQQASEITTLEEAAAMYAAMPVQFTPGEQWVYCQSGINTAARIVEVVSGHSFDEFLRERLFEPLGMRDTAFYLAEAQLPRLATTYRRTAEGTLEPGSNPILYGKSPASQDRFPAANGGLFSTAPDYARFCQMILNGGSLNQRRFLTPQAIQQMTTLQTGGLSTGFTPGNGWGLGWCLIQQPQEVTATLSPGTFGHGGAHGTQAWIDPAKGRIQLLMVQRANFPNSDASEVRRAFHEAVAIGL